MNTNILIIGAGPAGLSCASYLLRLGHSCSILSENIGGKLNFYNITNGFFPFSNYKNTKLIEKMVESLNFASKEADSSFDIIIKRVKSVTRKHNSHFDAICTDNSVISCKILVIATGTDPFIPESILERSIKTYYTFKDYPYKFIEKNDRVLILGAGNTAVDVVSNIYSKAKTIQLLDVKNDNFGGLCPVKRVFLLKLTNCQIQFPECYTINDIEVEYSIKGQKQIFIFDKLILCTGEYPNTHFLPTKLKDKSSKKILLKDETDEINISMSAVWDGLYALGDVKNCKLTSNVSYAIADGMRAAISINKHIKKS